MATLPTFARANGDSSIASYEWLDITSGCGYRNYYLAVSAVAAPGWVYTYFLTTRQNLDSCSMQFYTVGSIDLDFDITMKVPAIVGGGDFLFNYSFYGAAGATTVTITLLHVTAAGVETSLGSAVSIYGGANYTRQCHSIPLTTLKKFAIGEKIRITVLIAASGSEKFYIDPSSSLTLTDYMGRTIGTDAVAQIPFKIDI